jgi:hypothetical protein
MDHPLCKVPLYVGHEISCKQDEHLTSNFQKQNCASCLLNADMDIIQSFPSWTVVQGCFKTIAVLGIRAALTTAYTIVVACIQHGSIDQSVIVFCVRFEGALSIVVLRNRATRYKKLELEIVKFLKKSTMFTLRHSPLFLLIPMFFKPSWVDSTARYCFKFSFQTSTCL